ncbi:phage portal protein [Nocardioides hankookensis]|uniref:Phage portal protein n=1 Tax=Nocardioides hankookensis TaxID=443157 RepID=A0ABW1LR31_9ACTN
MSWPFNGAPQQRIADATQAMLAERTGLRTRTTGKRIGRGDALSHSAAWACLRLRADLISTMPVDVFRRINGVQVEVPKPPIFTTPGGSAEMLWEEWAYSTQFDLDSVGNTAGIILAVDGFGKPSVIELVRIDDVTFIGKGNRIHKVKIGRDEYDYSQIWHERQFTISGSPIGMSPIAHGAMTLNSYLSAQQFANEWFGNNTTPGGHLRNTAKKLKRAEALAVKDNFKASIAAGDVWVSGNDWEYNMLSAKGNESLMIEQQQFSVTDACRFLGVPADMIDAPSAGSSVTYANITQRNLQLLIMNIGPAIRRREAAFSQRLLAQPRYVKLNRAALLEMDLKSRYEGYKVGVDGRWLPPSRILELENMPPLTDAEKAEFAELFPNKSSTPAALPGGNQP